jgi:hypothetical protein
MLPALYQWFLITSFWLFSGSATTPEKTSAVSAFHPFYISVTEINQNVKEQSLEISCKMFAEDLELQIEKNYKTTLDISAEKDKATFDKYIHDYVSRHLAITVDGKPASLSYVGFEKEKESVYCYFEADHIATAHKVNITNSILHDFNQEQINIIHVTVNGHRQSTKLNFPDTQASFSF